MDNVVEVEFNKEVNETVQRFAKLVGLVEDNNDNILRDPVKYFNMAMEKIAGLQETIRRANDALLPKFEYMADDGVVLNSMETISMPYSRYVQLVECSEVIKNSEF